MRILEFEAKQMLAEHGLPIPKGCLVATPSAAAAAAEEIGAPAVLKAQVPIGGRLKAGGVRFAEGPAAAEREAAALFGQMIRGFRVEHLLVEQRLENRTELFVGALYGADERAPVLLASCAGGIEVERTSEVVRRRFTPLTPPRSYFGNEVAALLGFEGAPLLRLGGLITQIGRCFLDWDAILLEINPLVADAEGNWWAADVHLELDDDALRRQAGLLRKAPFSGALAGRKSEFERRAIAVNQADHRGVAGRLVPFDGNLGLLIGGGGASLTAFDAVLDAGLKPANYCEIGGNPSVWKIQELTKLILSQPNVDRLAVIMNVVSNTRVDLVARGVIKGILQLGRNPADVIVAFRIPGSWEEEGRAILEHYGVRSSGRESSIDQVVERIR